MGYVRRQRWFTLRNYVEIGLKVLRKITKTLVRIFDVRD
jgi:hypothetical protein